MEILKSTRTGKLYSYPKANVYVDLETGQKLLPIDFHTGELIRVAEL